ncbi:MAG: DNA polymerase II [Spirochaetaceae bacterium]|jgi:DNA polymerase-2|nr:DNA polymerase II [Spirochaetaceae bacterium]
MALVRDRFRGLLVHGYADQRRNRLYFTGRLEDGRSFAIMESRWSPSFHIKKDDFDRCAALLSSIRFEHRQGNLRAFPGRDPLVLLLFFHYGDRSAAFRILENAGISSPDGDMKPAEAFLAERQIRLFIGIRGPCRPGRQVDLVFPNPELLPAEEAGVRGSVAGIALRIASIDIETDTGDNSIRAIGCIFTDSNFVRQRGCVRVLRPAGVQSRFPVPSRSPVTVPAGALATTEAVEDSGGEPVFHPDEDSLLRAFIEDLRTADPDVLTGWNFLDFDFPRLAERCERLGIPFILGRSPEPARFFAGSSVGAAPGEGRRSAAALVPGRQVVDALRAIRSGPVRYPDYTLETVAQSVLGEGKLLGAGGGSAAGLTGDAKIAALDRLYREDPEAFGRYCYTDAELVSRILAKTGLFRLTIERAALTGVFPDKAWTSVVSFERIYGLELRRQGIAPSPPLPPNVRVSGAAGGTVLDPRPGLFNNIVVFDFRSLYPTIMLTFNIDPLSHALAESFTAPDVPPEAFPAGEPGADGFIEAPNGAVFSRLPGVLPALIAEYFAARRRALDSGDANAAYVYKILMNSFYGVLGTGACRYGRTELAGAITSFARKWLYLSRDWFVERGCPVLYGDTDSLFVEIGLSDEADLEEFSRRSRELARDLNGFLAERIREEYGLESSIELRFEKVYRRFMIPHLRSAHEDQALRGRAKGYGGYLLGEDGRLSVEVKGMEAVRSDATPLARRVQLELLELVFAASCRRTGVDPHSDAGGEAALRKRVFEILRELRAGKLDGELVYRKRLSRPPETYTASTPPQVKAARALGWKGRRGTVEYVITVNGPEPASLPHGPLDYDHYADSQVFPVARSIAAAAGWMADIFSPNSSGREGREALRALENGQMELGL